MDAFLAYLGPDVQRGNLSAVNPALLQGFIDAESATGKGAHTVALAGKTLNAVFKSALRAGHLKSNPAATIELPAFSMKEMEEFTPGDLKSLLSEARGTEWDTAIMLGAFCGCRLGDAVSIKWESVDLAGAKLAFVPQKNSWGSRRKTLELPLPARILAHLEKLASTEVAQQGGFITPKLAGRKIGGRSGLSLTFRAFMRRAGVAGTTTVRAKDSAARSFSSKSFHLLRHFFVSRLRHARADPEAAKAAAGHSSDAMSARYNHGTRERVQRLDRRRRQNSWRGKG